MALDTKNSSNTRTDAQEFLVIYPKRSGCQPMWHQRPSESTPNCQCKIPLNQGWYNDPNGGERIFRQSKEGWCSRGGDQIRKWKRNWGEWLEGNPGRKDLQPALGVDCMLWSRVTETSRIRRKTSFRHTKLAYKTQKLQINTNFKDCFIV